MINILIALSDEGKTIIISSHILPELDQMCSHIGIIEKGRMIVNGTVEEIADMLSSKRMVEVSVLDNNEGLFRLLNLNEYCAEIKLTEAGASFAFKGDDADLAALLGSIIKEGIHVISFEKKKYDLENVFMRVTGGDGDDA